jgi:hypothetical protein
MVTASTQASLIVVLMMIAAYSSLYALFYNLFTFLRSSSAANA